MTKEELLVLINSLLPQMERSVRNDTIATVLKELLARVGGGGSGGSDWHNDLSGRSEPNCHPKEAITGLAGIESTLNTVVNIVNGLKTTEVVAAANKAVRVNTDSSKKSTVDFVIDANDKILSQGIGGLLSSIKLSHNSNTGELSLLGKGDAVISSVNTIVDRFLRSVEVVINPSGQPAGTYLKFVFATDTVDSVVYVNLAQLMIVYTAGNTAISISPDYKISLRIDANSHLVINEHGLGIEDGYRLVADEEIEEIKESIISEHNDLGGREEEDCHPIEAITELQAVLDRKIEDVITGIFPTNITTGNFTSLGLSCDGILYFGSSAGVFELYNNMGEIISTNVNYGQFTSIGLSADGVMYFGSIARGIYKLNSSTKQIIPTSMPFGDFNCMGLSSDATLYFGSRREGIFKLDETTGNIIPTNITTGTFNCMGLSADGTLYFGSNNGVWRLESSGQIVQTDITSGVISAIGLSADGILYFGSDTGLYEMDSSGSIFFYLFAKGIKSIVLSDDGVLYLGGTTGIYKTKVPGDLSRVIDGSFKCMGLSADGVMYFGSAENQGVWMLDASGQIISTNKTDGNFSAIGLSADGILYFAGDYGIWYLLDGIFGRERGKWTPISPKFSMLEKAIEEIKKTSGIGGHIVVNEDGLEMPRRGKLLFTPATVEDIPSLDLTVVTSKGGVSVHNQLTGRDAANCHPMEAISGLADEFDSFRSWITAIINGGVLEITSINNLSGYISDFDTIIGGILNGEILDVYSIIGLSDILLGIEDRFTYIEERYEGIFNSIFDQMEFFYETRMSSLDVLYSSNGVCYLNSSSESWDPRGSISAPWTSMEELANVFSFENKPITVFVSQGLYEAGQFPIFEYNHPIRFVGLGAMSEDVVLKGYSFNAPNLIFENLTLEDCVLEYGTAGTDNFNASLKNVLILSDGFLSNYGFIEIDNCRFNYLFLRNGHVKNCTSVSVSTYGNSVIENCTLDSVTHQEGNLHIVNSRLFNFVAIGATMSLFVERCTISDGLVGDLKTIDKSSPGPYRFRDVLFKVAGSTINGTDLDA